jgi:hypothetical protein
VAGIARLSFSVPGHNHFVPFKAKKEGGLSPVEVSHPTRMLRGEIVQDLKALFG